MLSGAQTTDGIMLTTDQKGAIAEAEIAAAAMRLGVGVFRPLTDGERYDLIFDLRPVLVKVQCKGASLDGHVLRVPCYSAGRSRNGFVKTYYSAAEIDAIAVYSADLDRCFFVPFAEIPGRTCLQLRLERCLNNQRIRVNWADDFDFEARLGDLLGP
jgi:PD-(D/E)XK endonuclease